MAFIMTLETSKREFDSHIISWTTGGRIKIEDKIKKTINFIEYKSGVLRKLIDLLEGKNRDEVKETIVYFNPYAVDLFPNMLIEVLQDETAIFFVETSSQSRSSRKLYTKHYDHDSRVRQFTVSVKTLNLKPSCRYEVLSDGELVFLEEISPENINKKYDFAVVSVYPHRKK